MNLFYGKMNSPEYQEKRKGMVAWIVEALNCTETNAGQCLNDVESHSGTSEGGGSGVTALKVTVGSETCEVFHHSAGRPGTDKTATVFWIQYPKGIAKVVGLAKHQTDTTYQFLWLAGAGFAFTSTKKPTQGSTINPF
ncbi:hypothetical protein [Azospirillum picis]|uniref:Uncharacterized protein n=1 Tax=Azospirillum picis TaxID=488438 RepID=A0ABU0MHB6_9PROT|nr:hypothetical protein [Azospirillum picis]MBP2298932.1 hypothetical protein [Azospirillum picis]MDQ0532826.1 hypothetical protein [Azospirillum picis]